MSFLAALAERARARPRTLVFPEGHDPRIREAAASLARDQVARPVLLGAGSELTRAARDSGGRLRCLDPGADDPGPWVDAVLGTRAGASLDPDQAAAAVQDPLLRAALMVVTGQADGMVAGAVHTTGQVVRTAIRAVGPAPDIRTVSSSFYMVVPPFRSGAEEVLTFTDAGVVPDPDPEQLAEIAMSAAAARRRVVGDAPRVAFLSYSTLGSAGGPSVERVNRALEIFRARMPDVPADGELQGDAALVPGVAERKAPGSPVAGTANVLVFPDLDAGNIAYKLVQRLAHATALGPILQGLARPVNDLSRGATADDVALVACITSLMAD